MYTAGHVSNTNSIMSSKKQFILFFLATPGYSVVQVVVSGCGSSASQVPQLPEVVVGEPD